MRAERSIWCLLIVALLALFVGQYDVAILCCIAALVVAGLSKEE